MYAVVYVAYLISQSKGPKNMTIGPKNKKTDDQIIIC